MNYDITATSGGSLEVHAASSTKSCRSKLNSVNSIRILTFSGVARLKFPGLFGFFTHVLRADGRYVRQDYTLSAPMFSRIYSYRVLD